MQPLSPSLQTLLVHVTPGRASAVASFVLGVLVLPYPGVQTDEALFGAAIYQDNGYADWFRAWGHKVPTMLISYLGALKTWLYGPILQAFPPNAWTIRLPMLIAGALSILFTGNLVQRVNGLRAAWFTCALLATDPVLILTTTFDWGPVALQHLLLVAAAWLLIRYHDYGKRWQLAFGFFLLGLALWNKALVVWTFAGIGIALLAVGWPILRSHLRPVTIAIAIAAFAIGSFPFLRYNVRHHGATQANIQIDTTDIPGKAALARDTINGTSLLTYLVEDSPAGTRGTFIPQALIAAVILALFFPSRSLFFPLIVAIVSWILMVITKGAGGGVHHIVLLWPFLHWFLAAAFTAPRVSYATYAWVVIALLAADNARLFAAYRSNFIQLGSPRSWTEAVFPLSGRINEMVLTRIHLYDWGISDNIVLLAGRELPVWYHDRPFQPATIFEPRAGEIWIGNVDEREQVNGVNKELREAARQAGFEREVIEVFRDKQGRPAYEMFRFRRIPN